MNGPVKQHPEQQDDELYMGNTTEHDFPKSSWVTKRMGKVAHYAAAAGGGVIPQSEDGATERPVGGKYYPWFITVAEVEQAIRTAESEAKPWSAEKIAVYRKMLEER